MKGDHAHPAAGADAGYPVVQRLFQRSDFIIDRDTHRLKGAARRVAVILAAHGLGNGCVHAGNQIARGQDGLLLATLHNDFGNARRPLFIAVIIQRLGDRALIHARQPLRRRFALGTVHAHVQRRVLVVGKAALRGVQLIGGNAQIKQSPIQQHARRQ